MVGPNGTIFEYARYRPANSPLNPSPQPDREERSKNQNQCAARAYTSFVDQMGGLAPKPYEPETARRHAIARYRDDVTKRNTRNGLEKAPRCLLRHKHQKLGTRLFIGAIGDLGKRMQPFRH